MITFLNAQGDEIDGPVSWYSVSRLPTGGDDYLGSVGNWIR